jgi:tetratricopeptide (TPR) repeat protein
VRARVLIALGDCHRRAGRYVQARSVLDQVLDTDEQSPDLLCAALTVLGITAKELGEYERAARLYDRVEKIQQDIGASRGDAATLQHNWAGLEYARSNHAQAEKHARQALTLRQQIPRVARVDVAADLAVLGSTIAGQHRYEEARALFEQVLTICRAARPPRRYEIAVQLHNLAGVEHATGRSAVAESHYREALAIKLRLLGPDHPEVGLVTYNLATLLEQDEPAAAVGLCRRAVAIAERSYPSYHPTIVRMREQLDRMTSQ